jgi:hypothetical protein
MMMLLQQLVTTTLLLRPCPVCGEEAEDLTAHVRRAHGIDGVVCPHCAKILSKTCTLNRYLYFFHEPSGSS